MTDAKKIVAGETARERLIKALEIADSEGWVSVMNDAPPIGQRVEVMHILSRGYDTDGECDADGSWHCSNGFVLPNTMFTFNPTHWRLRVEPAARAALDQEPSA